MPMTHHPVIADFCPLVPKQRFDLLYADPPWYYRDRRIVDEKSGKARFGGGAMKHYPLIPDTVMLSRIAPMMRQLAADNAILLLWSVWPKMDFILKDFIPAAGFRFRAEFMTWVKTKRDGRELIYGPGYYTASNSEVLLLATKERHKPAYYFKPSVTMTGSVILAPRKEHSRKPILHDVIERMYPQFSKIELFARACYPGWQAWGNQTDKYQIEKESKFIIRRDLEGEQLLVFRDIASF